MKRVLLLKLGLASILVSSTVLASEGSPESETTGQTSSTRTASDVQTTITQEVKKDETERKAKRIGVGFLYNSKIILDTEKGDATVKKFDVTIGRERNFDADVDAGIFSYSREVGDNLTAGVVLPYRTIKVKDNVKSKLTMYSISPFVSFRTMKNGNFYNDLSFYGFLSLNTLKTDLNNDNTKDKVDYKELGFGATINPTYKFNDMFTVDFNFGYQYSTYMVRKSDITLSGVGDKDFIKKTFKPRHLVNLGTSLSIYPIENGKVIVGYAYSSNILGNQKFGKEERANYYYIKAYYTFWLLKFSLGYKKTDDADNYEEDTYMASVSLNF